MGECVGDPGDPWVLVSWTSFPVGLPACTLGCHFGIWWSNTGSPPKVKLFVLFCLSNGRYLVSGATDGCVYGWDVKSERMEQQPGLEGEPVLEPLLHHRVHADAVNGTRQV